jgi:hypothetical protein
MRKMIRTKRALIKGFVLKPLESDKGSGPGLAEGNLGTSTKPPAIVQESSSLSDKDASCSIDLPSVPLGRGSAKDKSQ